MCNRCQKGRQRTKGANFVSLADYEVALPLIPTTLKEIIDFKIDDFSAGRASQYDFLLSHKLSEKDLEERHAQYLSKNLADAVDIYLRMTKFFSFEPSDRVLLDNDLYGFNAAAKAAAEGMGVSCVSLNLGPSLSILERSVFLVSDSSTLVLGRENTPIPPTRVEGPEDQKSRVHLAHLQTIRRDLNKKLYGRHYMNYSRRSRRRDARKAVEQQRFSAALLLSGTDEPGAYYFARGLSHSLDQAALLKRFFLHAEQHPDDLFHVRPHPRFGGTHREGNESAELADFVDICSQAPNNVLVESVPLIKPIAEILRYSDCIVGGWSSVMIDAALMGVPVVFGIPGVPEAYPSDLGIRVVDEGIKTLTSAISRAKSLDRVDQHAIALRYSCDLLKASREGAFLPISLSPAFLLLAAEQRTSFRVPPVIHRWLRLAESSISPGFQSSFDSSDALHQIEATLTRGGPKSGVSSNSAKTLVPSAHSLSILQSVLEGQSRFRRVHPHKRHS